MKPVPPVTAIRVVLIRRNCTRRAEGAARGRYNFGMLEARSIHFGYQSEDVVRDVSITLRPGRVTALLGPNGSGKTTLMRLLLGHLVPRSGSVTWEGTSLASMSAGQA